MNASKVAVSRLTERILWCRTFGATQKLVVHKDAAAAGAQTRFVSTHFKFYLANHHHMDANKLHDTVKKDNNRNRPITKHTKTSNSYSHLRHIIPLSKVTVNLTGSVLIFDDFSLFSVLTSGPRKHHWPSKLPDQFMDTVKRRIGELGEHVDTSYQWFGCENATSS